MTIVGGRWSWEEAINEWEGFGSFPLIPCEGRGGFLIDEADYLRSNASERFKEKRLKTEFCLI